MTGPTCQRIRVRLVREENVQYQSSAPVTSSELAASVASGFGLADEAVEVFGVLLLDQRSRPSGWHEVSRGTLNASLVHPREVFKAAILGNAASIILMHNHPSGDPEPSREDIDVTKRIVEAGKLLGIPCLDHVIIGAGKHVSLADRGSVQFRTTL